MDQWISPELQVLRNLRAQRTEDTPGQIDPGVSSLSSGEVNKNCLKILQELRKAGIKNQSDIFKETEEETTVAEPRFDIDYSEQFNEEETVDPRNKDFYSGPAGAADPKLRLKSFDKQVDDKTGVSSAVGGSVSSDGGKSGDSAMSSGDLSGAAAKASSLADNQDNKQGTPSSQEDKGEVIPNKQYQTQQEADYNALTLMDKMNRSVPSGQPKYQIISRWNNQKSAFELVMLNNSKHTIPKALESKKTINESVDAILNGEDILSVIKRLGEDC